MKRPLLALLLLASAGCASQPLQPAPPPPVPIPSLTITSEILSRTTLQARAFAGDQDVTAETQWSSSDPGAVTVDSSGLVTILTRREATIRAEFRGSSGELLVAAARLPAISLIGVVQDGAFFGTIRPLSGVTVTLLTGPDAGRVEVTNVLGQYAFSSLTGGPATVEFAKAGYGTYRKTVALNDRTGLVVWLYPEGF